MNRVVVCTAVAAMDSRSHSLELLDSSLHSLVKRYESFHGIIR